MKSAWQALALASGLMVGAPAFAGPISAGQGMGPLGPRSHACQPGSEAAGRDGCRPFRSNDVSRRGDVRCAERMTRQGAVLVCRD